MTLCILLQTFTENQCKKDVDTQTKEMSEIRNLNDELPWHAEGCAYEIMIEAKPK